MNHKKKNLIKNKIKKNKKKNWPNRNIGPHTNFYIKKINNNTIRYYTLTRIQKTKKLLIKKPIQVRYFSEKKVAIVETLASWLTPSKLKNFLKAKTTGSEKLFEVHPEVPTEGPIGTEQESGVTEMTKKKWEKTPTVEYEGRIPPIEEGNKYKFDDDGVMLPQYVNNDNFKQELYRLEYEKKVIQNKQLQLQEEQAEKQEEYNKSYQNKTFVVAAGATIVGTAVFLKDSESANALFQGAKCYIETFIPNEAPEVSKVLEVPKKK